MTGTNVFLARVCVKFENHFAYLSQVASESEEDIKSPSFVPKRTGFWDHDDRYDNIKVMESRYDFIAIFKFQTIYFIHLSVTACLLVFFTIFMHLHPRETLDNMF